VTGGALVGGNRNRIVGFAIRSRYRRCIKQAICRCRWAYVLWGDQAESYRRVAAYVDKILKAPSLRFAW